MKTLGLIVLAGLLSGCENWNRLTNKVVGYHDDKYVTNLSASAFGGKWEGVSLSALLNIEHSDTPSLKGTMRLNGQDRAFTGTVSAGVMTGTFTLGAVPVTIKINGGLLIMTSSLFTGDFQIQ